MSNVSAHRKAARRQRSIYQVHYSIQREEEMMPRPVSMPTDSLEVQAYGLQVAGHMKTEDRKYLGVLQCSNGTIFKPIIKPTQRREVDFYERLSSTRHPDLVEMRRYVPKYYGCRKFTYNGYEQEYIVLGDLAERMLEPCIMDVKIGKRTWDPLATEEKIKSEQNKYSQCKQEFGFCIPGFQVFRLTTGKVQKYNKEYGKKLHGHMVRAAIKNFLNGLCANLCRDLILQFLSELWKIQKWASRQCGVKLYAASLLLVYDAARVRACCGDGAPNCRPAPRPRSKSIHSLHSLAGSNFSGQLTAKGPYYKKLSSVPITPLSLAQASFTPPPPVTSPWTDALEKLKDSHSFEHNYEDKLSKIKMNYRAVLDQLSDDTCNRNPWGTVKIIDFAHAFFNDEEDITVDDNFREGIDNFVEIFEFFLRETNDQVL